MTKLNLAHNRDSKSNPTTKGFDFPTLVCRKISTKSDEENGVIIYAGQATAASFLKLPEDENVREYLLDAGARSKKSGVHRAIEETLKNRPWYFPILNGGICIVAEEASLQDDQKTVRLKNPSIINGSQTRGVIRDYLNTLEDPNEFDANVKFELIVTKDSELTDDISIARNYQIVVKQISILGKKGYFDDLKQNFKDLSGQKRIIRTNETDREDNFIPTEKLIQVITALIPAKLWPALGKGNDSWNKAFAYSSAAGPLKLFEQVYKKVKEEKDEAAQKLYEFYIQIASQAWHLYEKWSTHEGFKGTRIKNVISKDEKGNILNVPDGIIFPIIAALSNFAVQEKGVWKISPPTIWTDERIILPAKGEYMHAADSNPQTMGKTSTIYASLHNLTSLVADIASTSK